MSTAVKDLVANASERTLRQATELGTIRGRRLSARRFVPAPGEAEYLEKHWADLTKLRRILGAKPEVRLGVVYGSFARGDDVVESDIDLLVKFHCVPDWQDLASLTVSVQAQFPKKIDIADWDKALTDAPLLTLQALDDGRVLTDKDHIWPTIKSRRQALYARSQRAYVKEAMESRV